ncbi:carbamoyltransferase N-terminal domain-containing protein [Rhodococcus erythropolis]|nr:carbamoyltransferase N-terminal domain-containing protein [Rhodococcus erythropolis]
MGEINSLSVFHCTTGNFKQLHTQQLRTSLGLFYSVCTRFLGYASNSDEYKVMGLSAYGSPDKFTAVFDELLRNKGAKALGWPQGAPEKGPEGYPYTMEFLEDVLRVRRRNPGEEVSSVHADIAAALQRQFSH